MGSRGPRPKSDGLKLLAGTRKDRLAAAGKAAPAPAAALPECPEYLDKVAAAEWARFVPILASVAPITEADGPALALYCDAFSRLQQAREAIEAFGLTCESASGSTKPNPAVGVAERASAAMSKILDGFGGTPNSRARLGPAAPAEAPADPLAKFLSKRKA